jgi:hypothetical protein
MSRYASLVEVRKDLHGAIKHALNVSQLELQNARAAGGNNRLINDLLVAVSSLRTIEHEMSISVPMESRSGAAFTRYLIDEGESAQIAHSLSQLVQWIERVYTRHWEQ